MVTNITAESVRSTHYLDKKAIAELASEDVMEGASMSFNAVRIFDPETSNIKSGNDGASPEDYSRNYNMYSVDEDEAERDGVPIRNEFNGVNRAFELQDENEEVDIFEILAQNQFLNAVHVDGNKLVAISCNRIIIVPDYAQALKGADDRLIIQLPSTTDDEASPMCFEHSRMIFELSGRLCILPLHQYQPTVLYISEAISDDPPSAMQATEDAVISTYSSQDDTYDWPHCQTIRWIDFSSTPTLAYA